MTHLVPLLLALHTVNSATCRLLLLVPQALAGVAVVFSSRPFGSGASLGSHGGRVGVFRRQFALGADAPCAGVT